MVSHCKNVLKTFTLDHIYTNETTLVSCCDFITPCFGDNVVVVAELNLAKSPESFYYNWDWSKYSPVLLNEILQSTDLTIDNDTVQEYWNTLENMLINIVDKIAPLKRFSNNSTAVSNPPKTIKSKINRRNNILQNNRVSFSNLRSTEIKNLTKK